jgi:hypothetical protein
MFSKTVLLSKLSLKFALSQLNLRFVLSQLNLRFVLSQLNLRLVLCQLNLRLVHFQLNLRLVLSQLILRFVLSWLKLRFVHSQLNLRRKINIVIWGRCTVYCCSNSSRSRRGRDTHYTWSLNLLAWHRYYSKTCRVQLVLWAQKPMIVKWCSCASTFHI